MAAGGPLALATLVPRLFSFFRHTIASVRLAVPQALLVFLSAGLASESNDDWLDARLFRFLFQNLIVEERVDVREATLTTWHAAVDRLGRSTGGLIAAAVERELADALSPWLQLTLSPPGVPLDPALFLQAEPMGFAVAAEAKVGRTGRVHDAAGGGHLSHNVDKNMLAQDLSLVAVDDILKGRLAAAEAVASLVVRGPKGRAALQSTFHKLALEYLGSTSSHQLIFLAVIVAEWAKAVDARSTTDGGLLPPPLPEVDEDARELVGHLIAILEGRIPSSYYEMLLFLGQIYTECQTLLAAFVAEAGIAQELIPVLPPSLVPTEPPVDIFGIETASHVAGPVFDALVANVGRKTLKGALPALREKQMRVVGSIGFYLSMKTRHDRQVQAAVATAVISLRTLPAKLNPVIRSIMNGIKARPGCDEQGPSDYLTLC